MAFRTTSPAPINVSSARKQSLSNSGLATASSGLRTPRWISSRPTSSYFGTSPGSQGFLDSPGVQNGFRIVKVVPSAEISAVSVNKHPPSRSSSIREPCCECGLDKPTFTCVQCNNDAFCEECWVKQRPHRPGAVGIDGLPHERTNRQVVERLREILDPSRTPEEQQNLHKNDEDTTWFGIARDSANLPIFQDYGRYASIMTESQTMEVNVRYPQLVSFIGQTGAGKSTLIKMLIDNQASAITGQQSERRSFPSPVTGSINDNIPTSGDVHLYSDPATCFSATPLLYADCEGLDGGENVPRGARFKRRDNSAPPSSRSTSLQNEQAFRKKVRKVAHSSQRDIAWATTPETRKREYAVTQLYPRLLYTFSDVVVFVLRNSKVFESTVLEKLLDWASASIEKSLNQPALPHAIIALNATDNSIDKRQWDVQEATRLLMSDIEGAITRVPRFQEYALLWKNRGKVINTTKDLLECYYSSITVVRIPTRGRYMLIDEQVSKLHAEIHRSCKSSYATKRRVRMLSTAEKLQVYLQSAFDHFSTNLNAPFDFVKEAIKLNPIPRDFRGNILKLAIAVRDHNRFPTQDDGRRIFRELSHMVASCVMLDSVRHGLLGTAVQLLDDFYVDFCDEALEDFCNFYWPCMFRNKNGRCENMKSGHNPKGHQNGDGKILAAGGYESAFLADEYADEWIDNIRGDLEVIQKTLQDIMIRLPHMTEQDAALKLHIERMNEFYMNLGEASQFVSHSTCFSCLRELPEHPLPCGHILCTPCIMAYGKRYDKTMIKVESCPLHVNETMWRVPWNIKIKPLHAGVRILSLDGGGVRGIVELEILKTLEKELGGELPIQSFFDLIVGTSTGGIIALGLGVENWSVETCIAKFTELCRDAFSPRVFHNVWGLEHITTAIHHSKYRTRPFETALQSVFEDRPLFGGQDGQEGFMIKTAVTTTTSLDQNPVVLTNYNRPDPLQYASYKFERLDHPDLELKTWEAARATSAAPPYFKEFVKQETKNGYIDGALYHNNPVMVGHHERKLIWPEISTKTPDIFLSIGTGHNRADTRDAKAEPNRLRRLVSNNVSENLSPVLKTRTTRKHPPFTEQLWNTVASRLDNILNCNRIWDSFRLDVLGPYSGDRRRYIRLNPDLRFKVPRLDEVSALDSLRKATTKEMVSNSHVNMKVKEVAHRLIASTFFFEKVESSTKEADDTFECKGIICCRFNSSSEEMKALGRFLYKFLTIDFTPYFVIQEDKKFEASRKVPLSEQCINNMCVRGRFEMDRIRIVVSKQLSATTISLCLQGGSYPYSSDPYLPISGFPRTLMAEDTIHKVRPGTPLLQHSGSLNKRPHRRRRHPRGANSPPEPSSLRRIKSQSNLRPKADRETLNATASGPESPDDVKRWASRRKSAEMLSQRPVEVPAETVFELADTSPAILPSETPIDPNYRFLPRRRSLFHLVV